MPWEETDQYVRGGHRSPEEFQPNNLRTIVLSEDEGEDREDYAEDF